MDTNNRNMPNNSRLSLSEMRDYFDGNLSGDELTDFNNKISNNEFYQDAIQGYETVPGSFNTISNLKNIFKTNKFKFWNTQNFFFATLLPTITILVVIATNNFKLKETPPDNSKISIIEENNTKEENALIEIEKAEIIPVEEQISYVETVNDQPKTIPRIDDKSLEYIQSLSPHKAVEIYVPKPNVDENDVVNSNIYTFSNFPIFYIIDLKTVDYRLVYKSKLNEEEFNAGGVESKYENSDSSRYNEYQYIKISYSYESFLQNALGKFKNGKFKEALYEFKTILSQFPEDLNAYFYGGLCYYNIGKYDNAVKNFDFVIKHYISTFDQEAEWYKAKTLLNMKNEYEAINLLETIVQKKGFYSGMARKQLDNL